MITDVARAELQAQGYTLLNPYHERDLVRVADGVAMPAGRLADDELEIPAGTETLINARGNKWWARGPDERVVLVCLDQRYLK